MPASHRRPSTDATRSLGIVAVVLIVLAAVFVFGQARPRRTSEVQEAAVPAPVVATVSTPATEEPTPEPAETTPPAEPQAHKIKNNQVFTKAQRRAQRRLANRVENERKEGQFAPFKVVMLNILGSQHTAGKRPYGPGVARAATAVGMLNARGASLIGFSEMQRDQLHTVSSRMPSFSFYPGESLGSKGVPQSLAWDTRVWELVEAQSFIIPFSGQQRPQPAVRLRNLASGSELWFINVHNSPQGMERERDIAEGIEIAKINELGSDGTPVIVTGDFNEKTEVLCRFTSATPLVSAVGGGHDGGPCLAPPQRARVDWIFTSPSLTSESHEITRAAPVPYVTDHALLSSTLSGGTTE